MSKLIDLTGKKFGKWTPLYHIQGSNPSKWHCRCDCGTEKDVDASSLRRGNTQSCGCERIEKASTKLIGHTFGQLIVIERDYEEEKKYIDRRIRWKCKCSCGNYETFREDSLYNNKNLMCKECLSKIPAAQTIDLTNQKFGKLLALEPTQRREYGSVVWKCICDCGNYCEASSDSLRLGVKKSCGCLVKNNLLGQRFGKVVVIEETQKRLRDNIVWKCRCDCGNIFYTTGVQLTRTNGSTLSCGCLLSKGEEKISKLLDENNIQYIKQKTFDNCRFPKTNAVAKFDFYVNNTYLIEFDGIQHYQYNNNGWNNEEKFKELKERDNFKTNWCRENHISIIRIPYTQYDNLSIKDLLLETSSFIIE